jgi:hypothetical protein
LPSLYSQWAVLLHLYETAFDVAQHWPITAITWICINKGASDTRNLRPEWINDVLNTVKKQRVVLQACNTIICLFDLFKLCRELHDFCW